jgi:hypothetical protein
MVSSFQLFSDKLKSELSDFFYRSAPCASGSRVRKKPREIHGYACIFCEPFSIKFRFLHINSQMTTVLVAVHQIEQKKVNRESD